MTHFTGYGRTEDCRDERSFGGPVITERKVSDLMDNMEEEKFLRPEEIEQESFRIIERELKEMGIRLPEDRDPVIRRVIHTTADFSYVDTLYFSDGALEELKKLLRAGTRIVTDTQMALSGINKKKVSAMGGEVRCFMAEPDVAEEAGRRGVTRATVSMERAAALPGDTVVVIGNAPTALLQLRDMILSGTWRPAFIVGVPVGFVNVEYAKECIRKLDVPCILNLGRKGGSNVAAAIINAVLKMID